MDELPKDWDLLYLGLNNVHIDYNRILSKNYSTNLYKGVPYPLYTGGRPEDNQYSPRCGEFIFLEGTGAIAINNNFCDVMIETQSIPHNFFTSDGAIMYYGTKKLNYFVALPQIIIQDLSIINVAEKINSKK